MTDVTANYGTTFDFIAFFGYFYIKFTSILVYLHQTFTDCISDQYKHFSMSTNQKLLQIIEGSLIQLSFFGNFYILHMFETL